MIDKIIEQRTCVACRTKRHKSEFIRCVRLPSGKVIVDHNGKSNGRGAYICHNQACVAKARKKRLFNRALKINVDDEIYTELAAMIDREL